MNYSVQSIWSWLFMCSDTCNYFSYFLQKSTGNEIQTWSFCRVRECLDMRLLIQFMVAVVLDRRKHGIRRHCYSLSVLFDLTSALNSCHVLKENKLSKIISRWHIVGFQQCSQWCYPKKSQWKLGKDLRESVPFISLMNWKMFLCMFVCLSNRNLFAPLDISRLLSVLD